LYDSIDTVNIRALNLDAEHGVLHAIKPINEKHDTTKWMESDADEQILLTIPFTGSVKLRTFSVGSGTGGVGPCKIKAFINRDDIDFDNVNDLPAVQEWELPRDNPPDAEHMFKVAKFGRVTSLTLFFETNYGEDTTRVTYLAFKGVFTPLNTEPVVAVYELRPVAGWPLPQDAPAGAAVTAMLPLRIISRLQMWYRTDCICVTSR
jgi:hypothetical protein